MVLHLLKLAVGVEDVEQLRRIRRVRAMERGGNWVVTRNHPRRAAEILAGGSLYWVIRGHIRVRQRVIGFRSEREESGRRYCVMEVAPELVATEPRPWRPFQGWRYLLPADAPADLPGGQPPADRMLAELHALGLI